MIRLEVETVLRYYRKLLIDFAKLFQPIREVEIHHPAMNVVE
jgi:hypothetical protein